MTVTQSALSIEPLLLDLIPGFQTAVTELRRGKAALSYN